VQFSHLVIEQELLCLWRGGSRPAAELQQNRLCLEFALCLSRACLGKIIILYINGEKMSFFHLLMAGYRL
jgi:hypothetical protein